MRCRTALIELDARHMKAKSQVQLAVYPDTCFLFRLPEAPAEEYHLPIRDGALTICWFTLLEAFESRLADQGDTHCNEVPVRLLRPIQRSGSRVTLFPLHSLRVSLVTALALEGQVPFPVLQKLVGHSRLMMNSITPSRVRTESATCWWGPRNGSKQPSRRAFRTSCSLRSTTCCSSRSFATALRVCASTSRTTPVRS